MISGDIRSVAQARENSVPALIIVSNVLAEKKIGKILAEFESWLLSPHLMPSTRRVYFSRFKQLVRFIESEPVIFNNIGDDFIKLFDAYIDFVAQEYSLKTSSINNYVVLFRLIAKVAGLNINFEKRISEYIEKTALDAEEQQRYINAACAGSSTRDLVFARMFLSTNIRRGEATSIKISDLIWEADALKVRIVSGERQREETLGPEIKQAIQSWLIERSRTKLEASSYLFPGETGGKLTGSSLDAALRKIGWRANLNVSARVLRNSYMTARQSKKDVAEFDAGTIPNIVVSFDQGQKLAGNWHIY